MVHFLVELFDDLLQVLHLVVVLFADRGRPLVLLHDKLQLVCAADVALQKLIDFLNDRIVAIDLRNRSLHERDDHLSHARLEAHEVEVRHHLGDFLDKISRQDSVDVDLLLLGEFAQKHVSLGGDFGQSPS